jgi:hypothetical protein
MSAMGPFSAKFSGVVPIDPFRLALRADIPPAPVLCVHALASVQHLGRDGTIQTVAAPLW